MLSRSGRLLRSGLGRGFHASAKTSIKVAVVGAAGGIGQPLSMLFKLDRGVSHLHLHDIVHTPGVAADLSHIPTPARVKAFKGVEQMADALEGMDFIVVPAGVPRKPGMTRDDLFNINASIVKGVAEAASKSAPDAAYLIISNPINSTVPIFAEVLKKNGTYNPKKLFGVTTLDCIRASTFVADHQNWDPTTTRVTVVGGHAGTTIIPLLSQVRGAKYGKDDIARLTHRIQFGGDEVVKAKDGAGSATLSMAYAGYLFGSHVVNALNGQLGIVECAFVENNMTEAPFFACPVTLGKDGIEHIHELGPLSPFEKEAIKKAVPDLIKQAEKGIQFVRNGSSPEAAK